MDTKLVNEERCYDRICKIIESCEIPKHIDIVRNLITNFKMIISDDNSCLIDILEDKLEDKMFKVNNFEVIR